MDYVTWGQEYLTEAQKLRQHIKPLKEQLRYTSGEDAVLLMRRLSVLNSMYLECLHTGRYLVARGERL